MHLLYIINYEQNYIGQRSWGNNILGKDRIFKGVIFYTYTPIFITFYYQNNSSNNILIAMIFIMYLLSANL